MHPKMIAYNPATGEIVGLCVTPPQVMAWQAQGLSTGDAASEVELDTHYVSEGQVRPKTVVSLTPDKGEIIVDGEDQAVVGVSLDAPEPPASIELLVGGQSEVVALLGGVGALSPVVAATPCSIEVRLADEVAYVATPVIIQAVSQ